MWAEQIGEVGQVLDSVLEVGADQWKIATLGRD
jgi:hypothetical protein